MSSSNPTTIKLARAWQLIEGMRSSSIELEIIMSSLKDEMTTHEKAVTLISGYQVAERLLDVAASVCCFTVPRVIMRRTKEKEIVRGRAILFFLTKKYTSLTHAEIGAFKGGDFSHSTVSAALKVLITAVENKENTGVDPQNWVLLLEQADAMYKSRIETGYYDTNATN